MNFGGLKFDALNKKWRKSDFQKQQLAAANLHKYDGSGVLDGAWIATVGTLIFVILADLPFLITWHKYLRWWIIVEVLIMNAVIFVPMWLFSVRPKRRYLPWLKFALDNNLQFIAPSYKSNFDSKGRIQPLPPDAPLLLYHSLDHQIDWRVSWPNNEFQLNCLRYQAGSVISYTRRVMVAQFKLAGRVPHIFIVSRQRPLDLALIEQYGVEEVELEGDFGKYFAVLMPPNYQIDVLQILTPDVMQTLIKFGQNYVFELAGDQIYTSGEYHSGAASEIAALKNLFGSFEPVARQIMANVKIYAVGQNLASAQLTPLKPLNLNRRRFSIGWIVFGIFAVILVGAIALQIIVGNGAAESEMKLEQTQQQGLNQSLQNLQNALEQETSR
ncbi:MAG: hypothetical protein LBM73_00055 [Candidatus Nomurabacteria bacterium]|jgi:hypothetical protein|nr:hypothetical protein [Candidatus Nomurabacteria bacterium]